MTEVESLKAVLRAKSEIIEEVEAENQHLRDEVTRLRTEVEREVQDRMREVRWKDNLMLCAYCKAYVEPEQTVSHTVRCETVERLRATIERHRP